MLEVCMGPENSNYLLREGTSLTISHQGKDITLKQGEQVQIPNR